MKKVLKRTFIILPAIMCFVVLSMFIFAGCAHEHEFSKEWSTNETEHWHVCTVEDCEEVSDKGKHEATDWIVDKQATCTEAGKQHKECTVCHKVMEEEEIAIDPTAHNYTYTYNYETKQYTAVCQHNNEHQLTVDAGTEMFPYLVNSEETFSEVINLKIAQRYFVKLACDIELNDYWVFRNEVTLDLNGKKIMLDAPNSSLESKPELMLGFSDTASRLTAPKTDIIIKNGKLEFVGANDSHTMMQVQGGSAVCFENVIINAQNAYGIAIFDKASLTLNGTSLKASGLAISSNNTESATPGNVVNLRNSLIESTEETALYVSAFAKVNIDRTVLKGKHSALTAMMGEFNVTGNSQFIATATEFKYRNQLDQPADKADNWKWFKHTNGAGAEGAAIVIRADLYYDSALNTNKLVLNLADDTVILAANSEKVGVVIYKCDNINNAIPAQSTENEVVNQYEIATDAFKNRTDVKIFHVENNEVKELVK